MDPHTKLLFLCFDLILPLAAGYFLARRVSIPERVFNRGMMVGITAVAPALALASFWCATLSLRMVWIPLLGVLMQLVPGLIGYWRVGRKYSDPLEQGSYLLSVMLSNRGVVGRLSVYFLYGLQGYAYAQLSMLLAPVVVYLFCFPMAQSYRDRHTGAASTRSGLRKLFTGPTQ
ncbi:transporter, partial [bacterium]|nr:transporter [bacterium]